MNKMKAILELFLLCAIICSSSTLDQLAQEDTEKKKDNRMEAVDNREIVEDIMMKTMKDSEDSRATREDVKVDDEVFKRAFYYAELQNGRIAGDTAKVQQMMNMFIQSSEKWIAEIESATEENHKLALIKNCEFVLNSVKEGLKKEGHSEMVIKDSDSNATKFLKTRVKYYTALLNLLKAKGANARERARLDARRYNTQYKVHLERMTKDEL